MKQKMLIVMPYFACGGVEKTLLSLLDCIDQRLFDVDMALVCHTGQLISQIPDWVHIHNIQIPLLQQGVFYGRRQLIVEKLKTMQWYQAAKLLLNGDQFRLTEDRATNVSYFESIKDKIIAFDGNYDIAIDYFGYASFTTFYVAEKVQAKVKVSWIHSMFKQLNPKPLLQYYEKFDRLFAVSSDVQKDMIAAIPTLNGKVDVFYNIISPIQIEKKASADAGFTDEFDGLRILTVARLSPEKGIDLAIQAMAQLKYSKIPIRWYVIGDGSEKQSLQEQICTEKLEDQFILLGMKSNPYPFMKQCDIYVQPSRFEGYCTTTNEARILGCPIIATDVAGMREQFKHGVTGIICAINEDALYSNLEVLINDQHFRGNLTSNLKRMNFTSVQEIDKLYKLLK